MRDVCLRCHGARALLLSIKVNRDFMRDGACLRSEERACGAQRLAVLCHHPPPPQRSSLIRTRHPLKTDSFTPPSSRSHHALPSNPCPRKSSFLAIAIRPRRICCGERLLGPANGALVTSPGERQAELNGSSRSQTGQALRFAVDDTLVPRTPARSWLASSRSNWRTKPDGVN